MNSEDEKIEAQISEIKEALKLLPPKKIEAVKDLVEFYKIRYGKSENRLRTTKNEQFDSHS